MTIWPMNVGMPGEFSDKQPFSADEFISRLVEARQTHKINVYAVQQALISWNEGAWDEVLEILDVNQI